MALDPRDIALLSQLLGQALELTPAERVAWLAALPAEHQHHAEALREMLAREATLDTDDRLAAMPRLAPGDESVARAGDRVGPYALLREIGRGGMGSVWLAARADGSFKRQVALKLPRLAWGTGLAERMAREREIGALLEHPNIARLYDAGVDERGRPYLALEYIDGQPIDAWCEAQGLNVRDRLRLFVQVARAVAYAHGRLVVHRDLKPSNVMVTPDGQAHLLDFGIAKLLTDAAVPETGLTQQQGRVLTPHYASPEQVAGDAVTVQSDVYSLGVLLYELLTSTLPIAPMRSTLGAVEDAILQGDAPPASSRVKDKATARALRGEVDAILGKAMQRAPARRYVTADAMAQDIERHLNGETVAARPDSVLYRLRKGLRRNWVGVTAVTAVLVAVLTGSGVAVVQAQRAARSAERERVVKDFVADVFRMNVGASGHSPADSSGSPKALLDGGAKLIQRRFSGQPELQAELYAVVGEVFSDMGAHRIAADYATHRVEALTALKSDELEQSRALLQLALSQFKDRRFADAELRVRRALEISAADRRMRLDALVLLARIQDRASHHEALKNTLRDIEQLSSANDPADAMARAWALAMHAAENMRDNRFDLGVEQLESAIELALQTEGPTSLAAVDMRLRLGWSRTEWGSEDKGRAIYGAALSTLRSLGGAHAIRAAKEWASFEGQMYLTSGTARAGPALSALSSALAEMQASSLPIPDWYISDIQFAIGAVMVDAGYIEAGLPLLQQAAPKLLAALGATRPFSVPYHLGVALSNAGYHQPAHRYFKETVEIRRAEGMGAHPYAATDYMDVAKNLAMAGRIQEAEAVYDSMPTFDLLKLGEVDPKLYQRQLVYERAQAKLAAGDAAAALALLKGNEPPPLTAGFEWHARSFNKQAGEAYCASNRKREGLELLQGLIAHEEQLDGSPYAPNLARLKALAGLCSLGLGNRVSALNYAGGARAAFTAQPGVSAYYKAPLRQLDRALGLKASPP